MDTFLALAVSGLVTGCIYALTASGLVVTYTTSGIFNFAHGAVGMIAAFSYWQLTVGWGLAPLISFALVVLVLAPAIGAVIERLLVRRLGTASLDVTLTVTVGLLLLLLGLATTLWDPVTPRRVQPFFPGHQVSLGGVVISGHQLVVVATAATVPLALWAFLRLTRAGVTLRAVVDDRELVALTGATPARVGQLGWALGSGLAGLAGVLLASQVTLNVTTLTLLVINGYAAAVMGRLRSLPGTFAGALLLGLAQAEAVGYVTVSWLSQVQTIIPMLFLFAALLLAPQSRLRTSSGATPRAPAVAGSRTAVLAALGFLAVTAVVAAVLPEAHLGEAAHALALALVLLSLVPLVGYGGMVSLCQLTFAGIGAVAMAKVGGSPLGLVAAVVAPAAVGVLIALPTLRLRGLHLALATLAFGYAMDDAFFSNGTVMGDSLSVAVPRPLGVEGLQAYLLLVAVAFAVCALLVLGLRRSSLGRRLVALGDSPTGCATVGMSIAGTKLGVFALSAGMAGLGGALLGGQQRAVAGSDFNLLLSLILLLLAVVWGVRTVSGVLLAGVMLELTPLLAGHLGPVADATPLLVGLGAIGIARNQNGAVGALLERLAPDRGTRVSLPPPRQGSDGPLTEQEVLTGAQG